MSGRKARARAKPPQVVDPPPEVEVDLADIEQPTGDDDQEVVDEVGILVGCNRSRTRFQVTIIKKVGDELDVRPLGLKRTTPFMADRLEAEAEIANAVADMMGAAGYVG